MVQSSGSGMRHGRHNTISKKSSLHSSGSGIRFGRKISKSSEQKIGNAAFTSNSSEKVELPPYLIIDKSNERDEKSPE